MNSELQNLFNQAVAEQSHGKTSEALSLYKKINDQGVTSAALELNKALLLEKEEDWGRALNSVEKAQFLARRPWLASADLERMQKSIGSNRAYSVGSLGELSGEISKVLRPMESLFLSSLFLGAYFLVRALGFKNRGYFFSIVCAALFAIFGIVALSTHPTKYFISDAELRSVPLAASAPKFTVGKGTKVIVLRESGEFTQVERPSDFKGWIPSSALKE